MHREQGKTEGACIHACVQSTLVFRLLAASRERYMRLITTMPCPVLIQIIPCRVFAVEEKDLGAGVRVFHPVLLEELGEGRHAVGCLGKGCGGVGHNAYDKRDCCPARF